MSSQMVDAIRAKDVEEVSRLLASGAVKPSDPAGDPDAGNILLFEAAASGSIDILGLALAKAQPADLLHANKNGVTALHAAVVSGNAACVRMLLEAGCDPEAATKRGRSATVLALDLGHADIARLVDDRIALRMLRNLQQAIAGLHHLSTAAPGASEAPTHASADGAASTLEAASRAAAAELGALQQAAAGAWQQMSQLLESVSKVADTISLLHGNSEAAGDTLGDASGASAHHRQLHHHQHDIYSSQWVEDGTDDGLLQLPLAKGRSAGTGGPLAMTFSPANPTNEHDESAVDHHSAVDASATVSGTSALLLPASRAAPVEASPLPRHPAHSPTSSALTVCYSF